MMAMKVDKVFNRQWGHPCVYVNPHHFSFNGVSD